MKAQLLSKHQPNDVVAFGGGEQKRAKDLLRDAARIAAQLPSATADSRVLLVFQRDRYHFAAAMLGALFRGHRVHITPSHRRDQVMAISTAVNPVAVLHDTTVGVPTRVDLLLEDADEPQRALSMKDLADDAGVIVLHDPKTSKAGPNLSLAHWIAHTQQLLSVATWPERCHVLCTLAPGHSLGLMLGVLAPLCAGGAMLRNLHPDDEEVENLLANTGRTALVTGPRTLNRLATRTSKLLAQAQRIYVAGQVSTDTERQPNVVELLTRHPCGPIAYRSDSASHAYTPCPDVQLVQQGDGVSIVATGHLHPILTNDRIAWHDNGTFDLISDADHALEVSGVRVDLAALEHAMVRVAGVAEVAAVGIAATNAEAARVLIACAAPTILAHELEAIATAQLQANAPQLCHELLCVEHLPQSADGETMREDLLRLFGLGPSGQRPNYNLLWRDAVRPSSDDLDLRFQIEVPQDCAYVEGHFPGYPIFPAAAQLSAMVLPAVRHVRPQWRSLKRMVRLKFLDRITPGDQVVLELKLKRDSCIVDFSLSKQGVLCSAGTLELSAATSA